MVMSVVLLLAACQKQEGAIVRPGPAAATPTTVIRESQQVTAPLPAPRASCTNAPVGWSRREDRQPGVRDVPMHSPGIGQVGGYLDSFTAVCGQTMSVHLSSYGGDTSVRLRALRIGDYQGLGSRLVWQSRVLTARRQAEAVPTGRDRVITERWPVATTIAVNAVWPPGMYLIEIAPLGGGQSSFISLAVRTSGVRPPYIVVASDLTWLAYNNYGGHSEYWTKRMYDAALQARDAGTNFGSLGANQIYWQGRIERDRSGRETALTVYRVAKLDRQARADPSTTTVQWRNPLLLRDPAAFVGVGMSAVGVSGAYVVNTAPAWGLALCRHEPHAAIPPAGCDPEQGDADHATSRS